MFQYKPNKFVDFYIIEKNFEVLEISIKFNALFQKRGNILKEKRIPAKKELKLTF